MLQCSRIYTLRQISAGAPGLFAFSPKGTRQKHLTASHASATRKVLFTWSRLGSAGDFQIHRQTHREPQCTDSTLRKARGARSWERALQVHFLATLQVRTPISAGIPSPAASRTPNLTPHQSPSVLAQRPYMDTRHGSVPAACCYQSQIHRDEFDFYGAFY